MTVRPIDGLREYLLWLESRSELVKVKDELSPLLEIPCFLRKVMYKQGPAVLFENVKGFPGWRVAGNLFPSVKTIRDAIGVESFEDIGNRFLSLLELKRDLGLQDKIKTAYGAFRLLSVLPKKKNKAGFLERTLYPSEEPLNKLPFFKTWPKDGGKYATFPIVITKDPEKGVYNLGVYRIMIVDGNRAVVHWQIHKRGALAHMKSAESGIEEMPVAVVIGSDPATMLAAVSPVPYPIDKFSFAGLIRGESVETYELENGIEVPANAEIVIEGKVLTRELYSEGPFGDHWGYYDRPLEKYPLLVVNKVHMREDAIYYGSVTGIPPLEDAVIGKVVERMFEPFIKLLLPEVVKICYPPHGVFQGMVIVSIKKRFPGHAKKVMSALWGLAQSSLTKIVVVVDHDIDPCNINEVIWALSSNLNPQRDVLIISYSHSDSLDPANIMPSLGAKLGLDATRKLKEENDGKEWPELVSEDPSIEEKVKTLLEKYLK